jgi:surface protein
MHGMFSNAREFDADIGKWNTTSVMDMSWMFGDAQKINADIGSWDTSRAIHIDQNVGKSTGIQY